MQLINLKRIEKHEQTLNKLDEALSQLEEMLDILEGFKPDFKQLMNYYGSDVWFEDVALSEKPDFPDTPHGVLSQDTVYNLYQQQRQLHFSSIRLALGYLE